MRLGDLKLIHIFWIIIAIILFYLLFAQYRVNQFLTMQNFRTEVVKILNQHEQRIQKLEKEIKK
jgi:hypothetical protein